MIKGGYNGYVFDFDGRLDDMKASGSGITFHGRTLSR